MAQQQGHSGDHYWQNLHRYLSSTEKHKSWGECLQSLPSDCLHLPTQNSHSTASCLRGFGLTVNILTVLKKRLVNWFLWDVLVSELTLRIDPSYSVCLNTENTLTVLKSVSWTDFFSDALFCELTPCSDRSYLGGFGHWKHLASLWRCLVNWFCRAIQAILWAWISRKCHRFFIMFR